MADPKHARREIDLTNVDHDNVPKRRRCSSDTRNSSIEKLDKVIEGVELLKKENKILKIVSNVFECIICKDVMQYPQYAPCCNRLLGCQSCIDHWLNEKTTCPHCSATVVAASYKDVRGMDDFLQSLCYLNDPTSRFYKQQAIDVSQGEELDSDDDFELPRFNFRHSD